jgi:hypothetical protein
MEAKGPKLSSRVTSIAACSICKGDLPPRPERSPLRILVLLYRAGHNWWTPGSGGKCSQRPDETPDRQLTCHEAICALDGLFWLGEGGEGPRHACDRSPPCFIFQPAEIDEAGGFAVPVGDGPGWPTRGYIIGGGWWQHYSHPKRGLLGGRHQGSGARVSLARTTFFSSTVKRRHNRPGALVVAHPAASSCPPIHLSPARLAPAAPPLCCRAKHTCRCLRQSWKGTRWLLAGPGGGRRTRKLAGVTSDMGDSRRGPREGTVELQVERSFPRVEITRRLLLSARPVFSPASIFSRPLVQAARLIRVLW